MNRVADAGVEPIPVVVIGFGRMGRLHARTFAALREFRVVAVVDTDQSCAAEVSSMGLPFLTRLDALREPARLAVVAVPSSAHAGVFGLAAARGMDCLVEKPVGGHLHELEAMVELADVLGVRVFAGYSEWFNQSMPSLVADVRRGPCTISVRRLSAKALTCDADSDVMHDLLAHDLDWLMRAAGAEPIDARIVRHRVFNGKIEEVACAFLFPRDVRVHALASRIAVQPERTVTICGAGGRSSVFLLDAPPRAAGDDPLTAQARALACALRGLPSAVGDIHDALRVQHILSRLKLQLRRESEATVAIAT